MFELRSSDMRLLHIPISSGSSTNSETLARYRGGIASQPTILAQVQFRKRLKSAYFGRYDF